MDLLESLYQRLLLSITDADPSAGPPITVGDLYQRLIPYRAVRGELRILELAEYEHALLRLLAGEGGYAQVEPGTVRLEIQRELASPNPLLGIYMDYPEAIVGIGRAAPSMGAGAVESSMAGSQPPLKGREPAAHGTAATSEMMGGHALHHVSDVAMESVAASTSNGQARISPASENEELGASPPRSRAPSTVATEAHPFHETGGVVEPLPLIYPPEQASAAAPERFRTDSEGTHQPPLISISGRASKPGSAPDLPHCRACKAALPVTVDVRFCPTCGFQQADRVCGQCGSRCAPEWSFCAGCGSSVIRTRA